MRAESSWPRPLGKLRLGAPNHVALTRQRESAQVFVAPETARDAGRLAWQMVRGGVKPASVAWATREDVVPARAAREHQASQQREAPQTAPPDRLKVKVRDAVPGRQRQPHTAEPVPHGAAPRDLLRRELLGLERRALEAAARANRVGESLLFNERAIIVQEVARQLGPVYAATADRAVGVSFCMTLGAIWRSMARLCGPLTDAKIRPCTIQQRFPLSIGEF